MTEDEDLGWDELTYIYKGEEVPPIRDFELYEFELVTPRGFGHYYDRMQNATFSDFYKDSGDCPKIVQQQQPECDIVEAAITKDDESVAEAMISGLHPDLLEYAKQCLMGDDIFDMTDKKNQFRQAFVRAATGKEVYLPKASYAEVQLQRIDEMFRLIGSAGEILVKGGINAVMEYVKIYFPKTLKHVIKMLRKHGRLKGTDLEEVLHDARAVRRISPSMDKLTKVAQLPFCESDHVYHRYGPVDGEVLIVGDSRSLGVRYKAKFATREEFLSLPRQRDKTYLINAVIGSDEGATSNDKQLLEYSYNVSEHNDVRVHMYMDPKLDERIRGMVFNKPRPHNMTVVVQLHPEEDPVVNAFMKERQKAITANADRNERFYGRSFKAEVKYSSFGPDIDRVLDFHYSNRLDLHDRQVYVSPRHIEGERRSKNMRKHGCNKEFDFSESLPHMKLVGACFFSEILHLNDTGVLDAEMVFRSLGIRAMKQGYTLKYVDGKWEVSKSRKIKQESPRKTHKSLENIDWTINKRETH